MMAKISITPIIITHIKGSILNMEFKRSYQLDEHETTITINYYDDVLESVTIEKRGHVLQHKYLNDELLECLYDGHSIEIDDNILPHSVAGSEYHQGLIALTDKSAIHVGDVQVEAGNKEYDGLNIFYKGKYFINMNRYLNSSEGITNPPEITLFTITKDKSRINITPNYPESEDMLFLLSFAKGRTFPYYQLRNLPGMGLKEVIMALSELYRDSVYLTFMEKLFGSRVKDCLFEVTEQEDCSRMITVQAKLGSNYMLMESTSDDYAAAILTDNGVYTFGDAQHLRELVITLPREFQ